MWYLYVFALVAGIASGIQPGQNATLAKSLAQPLVAGMVTLIVSAACLLVGGLATGHLAWPSAERSLQVPWWAWFGGVLGALLILSQLFVSRQIGAAPYLGLLVTMGTITSILLDHYGLIGFTQHPAGLWRIVGGGLMVTGVFLVALF